LASSLHNEQQLKIREEKKLAFEDERLSKRRGLPPGRSLVRRLPQNLRNIPEKRKGDS